MDQIAPLPGGQEAVLTYQSGDYTVTKRGDFVRCAVTGTPIPLDALRYWNPDVQEAYVDAAAMISRHKELAQG